MTRTTKGEQSKNKLIETAAEMFLRNGYNATGINDILASTGLPKGSFYFHFKSKKDLAVEVAHYFEDSLTQWIVKTAEGKQWEAFVTDLLDQMIETAENKEHLGCPLAVLGLEIAFSEPDISEHYSNSMKKLMKIFAEVFEFSGVAKDKAAIIASRACALYEGYLLYYRISKDVNALRNMQKDLIAIYKSFKEAGI